MVGAVRRPPLKKYLVIAAIVLLVIAAALYWRSAAVKPPPEPEGQRKLETKKEVPARPAKVVLRSPLAGTWYPGEVEILKRQISDFFQKAKVKPINNVIALILPHAGYRYSGRTAVAALKNADKKYQRIIVIGPTHSVPMREVLSVPRVTHYETPLGQVELDLEFIDKLLEYSLFQHVPQAHKAEHSVQIELPLLQYKWKEFRFVPIVAGSCSPETIEKAGAILRSLVDSGTLVVASSDFVHFGPGHRYVPFTQNIAEEIRKLDMGAYGHIANIDYKGFVEYRNRTGATICGYIPVAILLAMLDRSTEASLVEYATSGELTGDFTNSVSYLSVAFSGVWTDHPQVRPRELNPNLSEQDKQQLLLLARKSIVYFLQKRRIARPSELGIAITDALREPRAAFVTLKKQSQLRGCIGDIFPRQPLYQSVMANAINACVNDRRFKPVQTSECEDIHIEISVLTPPEPVASPKDIRVGVDGVVLSKAGHSAVFLPQVATEQGWDLDQMLTRLSVKAKLPPEAWKEGARFLAFQAAVFGEIHK